MYPVAAPLTSGISASSENITVPFESTNSKTIVELVANNGELGGSLYVNVKKCLP